MEDEDRAIAEHSSPLSSIRDCGRSKPIDFVAVGTQDSITAFTILANEIAEDRATAGRGTSSPTEDDGGARFPM